MEQQFADINVRFLDVNGRFDAMTHRFDRLPEEIAKFNRGQLEVEFRRELHVVDGKYADLPARVKKLEERATPRAKARRRTRAS